MTFFVTNRMAFGRQPGLKSVRISWVPKAVRGSRRIEKARLRGLYVAGTAAAYMECRAAAARREGDSAVETAEVLQGAADEERPVTAAGSRGPKVPDEQRETMEYKGGIEGKAVR